MVLIKLESEFFIQKKEIISISDLFFQVCPSNSGTLEIKKLNTKPNSQNQEKEKYFFESAEKTVTIGRDSHCNIALNGDKGSSKIQTTFSFDTEANLWKMFDGTKDKPSTNGTWLYAAHSFEIKNKTVLRVGNSKLLLTYQ